jgi:HEAT repeat protein
LDNTAAVPLLIPALSDANAAIRGRAATALGLLHAEIAIPQLSTMLRHDGPGTTRYAAEALAAIGTPAAMAALTAPLADQGMTPARYAAMAALETAGRPAVVAVVAALNDSSAVVRANAAEMLGWLGPVEDTPQRAVAVADLTGLLSDPDPAVQAQAAWALGELGTEPARLALLPAPNIPAPNPAPVLAPMAARPVALAPLAALPGELADVRADNWTLAATATLLVLVLLGMLTIVLTWRRPRPTSHLGHA